MIGRSSGTVRPPPPRGTVSPLAERISNGYDRCLPGVYDLYVDQMLRGLTGLLDRDEFVPSRTRHPLKRFVRHLLARRGLTLGRVVPIDVEARSAGRDWPLSALTMIGLKRLENLRYCVETVLREGVPGDIIETGVWRGGASLFARAVLAANGDETRTVWLADSFQGLPPPNPERYPADATLDLSGVAALQVPLEEVEDNFRAYGFLDERVRFVEGWFRDTLPSLRGHVWSVVRLDGDLYESTMDGLANLYPGLSPGGFLIVDDYGGLAPCRAAVDDYRRDNRIAEEIVEIDWAGVYWRKAMA